MDMYFSGAAGVESRLAINANQLFAQQTERTAIKKAIKYKEEHPECTSKIMIDSGAFSAYTRGLKLDIDDYIKFINEEIGDKVDVFVSCDMIQGSNPPDDKYAQGTWDNWLYMWERIKPEFRHKLMCTFHNGDNIKFLRNMLNWRGPNGEKVEYLGIGGVAIEKNFTTKIRFVDSVFDTIKECGREDIKTHGFGLTIPKILEKYPFTSCDSTSYLRTGMFGLITINNKSVCVSNQKIGDKDHYKSKGIAYEEEIKKIVTERGFKIEELEDNADERHKFNVYDTLIWVNKITENHSKSNVKFGITKPKKLW